MDKDPGELTTREQPRSTGDATSIPEARRDIQQTRLRIEHAIQLTTRQISGLVAGDAIAVAENRRAGGVIGAAATVFGLLRSGRQRVGQATSNRLAMAAMLSVVGGVLAMVGARRRRRARPMAKAISA